MLPIDYATNVIRYFKKLKESIIENVEDNEAFTERVSEDLVSYDAMIRKLKNDGCL